MRLENATIIMTPHVHLHHFGFLISKILNSIFVTRFPTCSNTNTVHFARRAYLCNEYCVMGCVHPGPANISGNKNKS